MTVRVPRGYAADYVLGTTSGDIRLYAIDVDKVKVNTTSGDVRVEPDAGIRAKEIDVTTISGSATVSACAGDVVVNTVSRRTVCLLRREPGGSERRFRQDSRRGRERGMGDQQRFRRRRGALHRRADAQDAVQLHERERACGAPRRHPRVCGRYQRHEREGRQRVRPESLRHLRPADSHGYHERQADDYPPVSIRGQKTMWDKIKEIVSLIFRQQARCRGHRANLCQNADVAGRAGVRREHPSGGADGAAGRAFGMRVRVVKA